MGVWWTFFSVIGILFLVTIGLLFFRLHWVFGVGVPYCAFLAFVAGFLYRVLVWARSPVPFHIPTISGQHKSLPWIRDDKVDSPATSKWVVARLALEILFFRSLLKNEKVELKEAYRLLFKPNTYLWIGSLVFHWSFMIILFRHLRFFLEPVPSIVTFIQWLDSLLQGLIPALYITDLTILLCLVYLFFRRVLSAQIRYISLPSDYFSLLLIAAIAVTGMLMRLFYRVDLVYVKTWAMRMISIRPQIPQDVGLLFYIHIFFVSLLIAFFPLSKLMHMAGIFLSPTRNLTNTSRSQRHINPWNAPVKVHTYEEWEDEFRESMKDVGLPVEKE